MHRPSKCQKHSLLGVERSGYGHGRLRDIPLHYVAMVTLERQKATLSELGLFPDGPNCISHSSLSSLSTQKSVQSRKKITKSCQLILDRLPLVLAAPDFTDAILTIVPLLVYRNIQLLQYTDCAYLISYLKMTFYWPEKISHDAMPKL